MGFYISIRKIYEDASVARYSFGDPEDATGVMILDRGSGEISLESSAPNDPDGKIYARAARKIRVHWEKGELPDRTCWAT